MRTLLMLAVVTMVAGCSPAGGSPCSTPGALQCAGASTLLACEGSTWAAYPCPSCEGTTCNWKSVQTGAGCPEGAQGDGWCPFDGRVVSCFWSSSADAGVFIESACSPCTAGKTLRELGRCATGRCSCQ